MDLHGVGGLAGTIREHSRDRGSISYHPIPLARPKIAADVKNHLLPFLCLGLKVRATATPTLLTAPLSECLCSSGVDSHGR